MSTCFTLPSSLANITMSAGTRLPNWTLYLILFKIKSLKICFRRLILILFVAGEIPSCGNVAIILCASKFDGTPLTNCSIAVASRPRLAVMNSINPTLTPNVSAMNAAGLPNNGIASSTLLKITLKSFKLAIASVTEVMSFSDIIGIALYFWT